MGRTKSKKSNVPLKTKLKKDPGVPKLPDLKAKNVQRQRAHATHQKEHDPDALMASEPTLSSLAQQAAEKAAQLSEDEGDPGPSSLAKTKEQLRKYYLRTLHKVVDDSDIVILVLDARDPEGCRSRLVEEEVRRRESEGKRLVFVLNKVDLIPRANAQAWLKYLRHSTPTLPFLSPSSSQHQRTGISSATAPSLLKLLKAYKPKSGSVTIGVVGYPNVGKSSLINSLKRSKVCAVAANPGHTKELQSVQLERGMRILDSPGVVFDDDYVNLSGKSIKKGSVLLRNVVKVEDVEDPIAVVEEVFDRTTPAVLRKIYDLPEFNSTLEFLTMLALKNGKLLKGGTPDLNSAARQVLTDWNHQKIPYYSEPPSIHPSLIPSLVSTDGQALVIAPGAENVGQAKILNEFSKPFELEGLFGAADAGAFGDSNQGGDVPMQDEEGNRASYEGMEAMDEDNGNEMNTEESHLSLPLKRRRSPSEASAINPPSSIMQSTSSAVPSMSQKPTFVRQPKRQRKNKDIPDYHEPPDEHVLHQMERGNPLSRKNLKREAKRTRRAGRTRGAAMGGAGMEVDDEGGLQGTFMD
ncbi:hypothetical protein AX16_009703 [Volvariella volvacea WC 439]|nr:hypothetical protein AX16_009703 [Volvariella volvacea WC 439]